MDLFGIIRRKQDSAVDSFGAPGGGKSMLISAVTVVILLFSWWLVTKLALVKPLFLPSPADVFAKFEKIACTRYYLEDIRVAFGLVQENTLECAGFSDSTLLEHTMWSLYRVFTAFFLAVVTAVPIGVSMGMHRISRGMFDPLIEFYLDLLMRWIERSLVPWKGKV
jgi:taurine transport system permease protein